MQAASLEQAVEVLVQLHECDGDRGREGADEHACSRTDLNIHAMQPADFKSPLSRSMKSMQALYCEQLNL